MRFWRSDDGLPHFGQNEKTTPFAHNANGDLVFMLCIICSGIATLFVLIQDTSKNLVVNQNYEQRNIGISTQGETVLLFEDKFDRSELDLDRWTTCHWWASDGCTIASNNELEWYLPENVMVENGRLILQAEKSQYLNQLDQAFPYTSGMVTTARLRSEEEPFRFIFHYGLVEVKAKVPKGKGLWPAIWMLPADLESKPEIDIAEILGDQPNILRMHYHYVDKNGARDNIGKNKQGADLSAEFHTYGLDWQPDHLIWYLDGEEVWRYSNPEYLPDEPMYLILNLAVGGDWPGAPDETVTFPKRFEIEEVRVSRYRHREVVIPLLADLSIQNDHTPDPLYSDEKAPYLQIHDGKNRQISLLKFDSSYANLKKVTSASFQFEINPITEGTESEYVTLYHIKGLRWQEDEPDWSDWQQLEKEPLAQIKLKPNQVQYEISLDSTLLNTVLGGEMSFMLTTNSEKGVSILAQEHQDGSPRLSVKPLDFHVYTPYLKYKIFD